MAFAHLELGNLGRALSHSAEAVRLLDRVGPIEVLDEEILYNHYLVLRDNQDLDEATRYLKKAYSRMKSKADKIKDSGDRELFLNRVPVNRNIRSSWEEQNIATTPASTN